MIIDFMIIGIGVDIVDGQRIRRISEKFGGKFTGRIFTAREIAYCSDRAEDYVHFAGRFAVKEAMFKALGTGWRFGILWKDIEVLNNSLGAPEISLHGKAREISEDLKTENILTSISHDGDYAVGMVVLESSRNRFVTSF